jgi:hypothetical protein
MKTMKLVTRAGIGIAAVAAALAGAATEVSVVRAADADLRGSWKSEIYTLKDGTRHTMPGLIFFTKSDWSTLWLITVDGKPRRGAGEGGTYIVSGNKLTFTHLFNVSGGGAVAGLPESPLRLELHEADSAPTEPCTVSVAGDRLVIHFPSGNQIRFTRSSGF